MKQKGKVKFVCAERSMFFPTLKKRVDQYFVENNLSKNADSTMILKSVVLLLLYIVPFLALITLHLPIWAGYACWALMGAGVAGIGMSIMHDANHGAYSSDSRLNKIMGYTLNLAGGAVENWKFQHNILHHTYTNIIHMDDDIQDRLILRLSPHSRSAAFQRFQWVYAFFLYGILTLYWVTLKDFIQYISFTSNGVNNRSTKENRIWLSKMILMKVLYFGTVILMPIFVFGLPALHVLLGFLLMHFVSGVILTVIFQLAHTVEGTTHPLPNENGIIENDWAIHQLQTTVNFSRDNKWLSWYIGGLNFQVEHHLFPKICHVHYPAIAPIVKETAEEFGLNYMEYQTFSRALESHIITLQRFGQSVDLNHAIG